MNAVHIVSTTPLAATPVIKWIKDPLKKNDAKYRISIDGTEYIRSTRKKRPTKPFKKPRAKKPRAYKHVFLTPEERVKRKEYMYKYRLKRKQEVRQLEAEVIRLNLNQSSEQSTATATTTTTVTVTGDVTTNVT